MCFILQEYAKNLKETGVHGAMMVLEPQFNSDTLATALGIPPSKSYIRRHLKTELDALVKPARCANNVKWYHGYIFMLCQFGILAINSTCARL